MNPENSVEQRLEKIEDELRQIKERLEGRDKRNWISRMRGQFKDDPVFDEIVRLSKEIRDAELPTPDTDEEVGS